MYILFPLINLAVERMWWYIKGTKPTDTINLISNNLQSYIAIPQGICTYIHIIKGFDHIGRQTFHKGTKQRMLTDFELQYNMTTFILILIFHIKSHLGVPHHRY